MAEDKLKTFKTLQPGDIIALFGVHNPSNERCVVYGEVVSFEANKELVIAQTIRETAQKEVKRAERIIKIDDWGIMAVIKFGNWNGKELLSGG